MRRERWSDISDPFQTADVYRQYLRKRLVNLLCSGIIRATCSSVQKSRAHYSALKERLKAGLHSATQSLRAPFLSTNRQVDPSKLNEPDENEISESKT